MSITRSVTRGVTRPVTRGIGEHFFGDSTEMTLRYDFANKPSLDALVGPTLTIARASTATVTDYDNVLRTVKAAEARFTGGRRVENLCLQSEDLSTTWTNSASIDEQAQGTAPDGTNTANKITDDSSTGTGQPHVAQNITVVNATVYTYSVYLKADQLSEAWVFFDRGSTNATMFVNLSDGTIGATANVDSSTTEDVGNGWYRFSLTTTSDGTAARARIYPADGGSQIVDLDGTSSIFVWGAQLENVSGQSDPSPSTYIPTTTAAVSKWYATKRRTNLCLQSQDFTTTWAETRSSTIANSTTAPDGTVTADTWHEDATGALNHQTQMDQQAALKANTTFTFSLYLKAINRNWVRVVQRQLDNSYCSANFDVTAGAGAVGTTTDCTAAISDAGDGWYRCSMIFDAASGTPSDYLMYLEIGESDNDVTFDGLDQDSLYYWGAQLEKGSTATAYIATTTTVASSTFDTAITTTGLLVEEARTNICLQSETFDNATWTTTSLNAVINADDTVAPDGATTADQLIDDASTGTGSVQARQPITVSTSTVYTASFYAKADQLDWTHLSITSLGSLAISAYYDLTNGVVGVTVGADNTSEFIEDVGNGWYRCGIVFTSDASDGAGFLRIYPAVSNNVTVDLDGTSSIFIWGAQLEAGAFPTSYTPTTTVSVTRAADDITTTDVSWADATKGSFYSSFVRNPLSAVTSGEFNLSDGTANNRALFYSTDVNSYFQIKSGGSSVALPSLANLVAGTLHQKAGAYELNNVDLAIDGTLATTDTSAATPVSFTTLEIGAFGGGSYLNGHIAEIRYYNSRLDNAALLNMSNGIFP